MLDKRKTYRFFESEKAKRRLKEYLEKRDCYPLDIVIHLNTTCNHRCDFCYNFLNLEKTNKKERNFFLDGDYVLNLINQLAKCDIDKLIISGGGEPLLHKDIRKILETSLRYNFSTILYTNLDNDIDDLAILLAGLNSIHVNINTTNKEIYNKTRGEKARFSRVKRNLERLIESNARLYATIIVRDNTCENLEETIYQLNKVGLKNVNISPAFKFDYRDGIKIDKSLKEMEKLRQKIHDLNIKILEPEGRTVKDSNGNLFCKIHYFDITIGADYCIYPCCTVSYLEEYRIINLKDYNSFRDAWNSEERYNWIKKSNIKCKTCWFAPVNEILEEQDER